MIIIKANVVGEFRRFRVEENITFHGLCEIFSKILLPTEDVNLFLDSFTLKYEDDEKDMVVVSCTSELEEAIRQAKVNNEILRMNISQRTSDSFILSSLVTSKNTVNNSGILPTITPTPEPDVTPEPDFTPEPDVTPEPDFTPEPDVTPEPVIETPEPELTPSPDDVLSCSSELTVITPDIIDDLSGALECTTIEPQEILSFAQQIAYECARTAAEMSRTCSQVCNESFPISQPNDLTSRIVNDCKNLSMETARYLYRSSEEINGGQKPFHDGIVAACLQASESCLSSMATNEDQVISDVNNVIKIFHAQQKSTYEDESNAQKKTCDSLRFAIDADCTTSVTLTRDQCLSWSDSIVASIKAL